MLRGLSSLTCDACEFAVRILLDLFHVGNEWDYLATAAGDLCYVLKIEDRNVCMPITQLFKVLVIIDVLNDLHHKLLFLCQSYDEAAMHKCFRLATKIHAWLRRHSMFMITTADFN